MCHPHVALAAQHGHGTHLSCSDHMALQNENMSMSLLKVNIAYTRCIHHTDSNLTTGKSFVTGSHNQEILLRDNIGAEVAFTFKNCSSHFS